MRRVILVVSAVLFLGVILSSAQSNDEARVAVERIVESLASDNTNNLVRLFAPQIELTVGGQTSLYTRAQAKYVTGAFLDQHPLRSARVREIHVLGRQCTARSTLVGADRSEVWDLFLRLRETRRGWEVKEMRLTPARAKTNRQGRPGR